MSMVGFPLLLIPVAIYNIIAFLMPGVSLTEQAEPLFKLTLVSGIEWPVTLSDILLALGILMLMFEVIKGARPGAKYLTDHLLSLIVFGAAAAEFVLWPRFGTSTYFLLALLALVDFLSGIALRARRSAWRPQRPPSPGRTPGNPKKIETPVAEPQFDPHLRRSLRRRPSRRRLPHAVPAAASVAESVLLDHPGPRRRSKFGGRVECRVGRQRRLAGMPSPGLQPGTGAPPSPDAPR